MSRAALYTALSTNTKLAALGFIGSEVYGSTGMENTKADKFIVIRWGPETPAYETVGTNVVTIWVYDTPGSYVDINKALKIIRDEIILPMTHVAGNDGECISQTSYNGLSEDLFDDTFIRITRNGVFTINTHHNS